MAPSPAADRHNGPCAREPYSRRITRLTTASAGGAPLPAVWTPLARARAPLGPHTFPPRGHAKPTPTTAPCHCIALKRVEQHRHPHSLFALFPSRHDRAQRPPPPPGDHPSTLAAGELSAPSKSEPPLSFFPLHR
jgi:hypothetical protein